MPLLTLHEAHALATQLARIIGALTDSKTRAEWRRRKRMCHDYGHVWSPRTTPTKCSRCGTGL